MYFWEIGDFVESDGVNPFDAFVFAEIFEM